MNDCTFSVDCNVFQTKKNNCTYKVFLVMTAFTRPMKPQARQIPRRVCVTMHKLLLCKPKGAIVNSEILGEE